MQTLIKFRWILAQFKATLLSCLTFIGVTAVIYSALVVLSWQMTSNLTARNVSTLMVLPLSAIVGAVAVFFLTPWILRFSWPVSKIETQHELNAYFTRFGRTAPRWIEVESMPEVPFQAWATGFNSDASFFQPAIFYTRNLKETLSEGAVRAVFCHEISHLILNHPFQRGMRSLLTFGASSGLIVLMMAASLLSKNPMMLVGLFPVLLIGSLYARMHFSKFVAKQESEADEFAVDIFGASPQDLIDALRATPLLAKLNEVRVRALQQKYAGRIFRPDIQKQAA